MSRIQSNKTRIGLIAVALVGGINFASSAFSAEALPQGYQLASAEKTSEGKCGEGKCGAEASAQKTQAEGKCGEGKCGDASFARTDTDDDGRVSLKELLAVAPKGTGEFKAMDTNGDGFLSEGEVYKFRTNQFISNGKKVPTELFTKLSQAKD
ncbi:EF hand domain-containing protein [Pseudomonas sp. IT-196MI5]|uniref:HvfA family oxazolone/thioamide-modified RiPP metallophore n=1 Tax=Pseudomonas sp. IT-196MI5 TaxID=3026440 RepID=UPI0039E07016